MTPACIAIILTRGRPRVGGRPSPEAAGGGVRHELVFHGVGRFGTFVRARAFAAVQTGPQRAGPRVGALLGGRWPGPSLGDVRGAGGDYSDGVLGVRRVQWLDEP